jgi:hypothetical protein
MKKWAFILLFSLFFFSCHVDKKQITLETLQRYLVDGVILDDQRPMVGILSEQEVLLKAADIAVNGGFHFDISSYLEEEPALLTAKIETPVLLHRSNGEPWVYMLYVVDEKRTLLMIASVKCEENVDRQYFLATLSRAIPNRHLYDDAYYDAHYITKREVKEYTKRRFPDKNISEPVAITNLFLEEKRHSNSEIFWYFQVEDKSSGSISEVEEYIIAATVMGNVILNENNRSLISSAYRGSPQLNGYRMAKLSRPLNFQYYGRNSSRSMFEDSSNIEFIEPTLIEPMGFTGVPLE